MRKHTLEKCSRGSSMPLVTEDKVPIDGSSEPSNMLAIGSSSWYSERARFAHATIKTWEC